MYLTVTVTVTVIGGCTIPYVYTVLLEKYFGRRSLKQTDGARLARYRFEYGAQ